MKKASFLLLFFACAIFSTLQAQLPERAEDISPLLIGETMPDQELFNTEGQKVSFHDLLKDKMTVLIFYRGGWCPYCNAHLAELGQRESEILELGYEIMAVSPDAIKEISKTGAKDEINYELLSDADGSFSKAVGIAFKAPDRYENRLFKVSDGQNTGHLPVPSVFVLNENGQILFEYINPDYKQRMSAEMLLAVLKVVKEEK
jgi:peroxiredoxin